MPKNLWNLTQHQLNRSWSKVGTDLFQLGARMFLKEVDYYSKLLKIPQVKVWSMPWKRVFSRHGIPDQVNSDGGQQYSCHRFREFGFIMSSPRFPQSNALAKQTIQTVNNMSRKAIKSNQDPYLSLWEYKNTPIDKYLGSPCQLLISWRTKTTLPTNPNLLKPEVRQTI